MGVYYYPFLNILCFISFFFVFFSSLHWHSLYFVSSLRTRMLHIPIFFSPRYWRSLLFRLTVICGAFLSLYFPFVNSPVFFHPWHRKTYIYLLLPLFLFILFFRFIVTYGATYSLYFPLVIYFTTLCKGEYTNVFFLFLTHVFVAFSKAFPDVVLPSSLVMSLTL